MDSYQLKEYIIENNKVEFILQELGCVSIKYHNGYWTCGNPPPSDNRQAITVYNNEFLNVINYTKDLGTDKSDIFTLIEYINKCNFFEAMLWCCNILEIDYYHSPTFDLPESIRITKMLMKMKSNEEEEEDDTPIRVLDEKVLKYYKTPCVNDMFLKDGISYDCQKEFFIGYDEESNRITFPIFDEINSLVSIKARLFKEELSETDQKYIYLYKCPRNKILFGLNKTHDYIKENGMVYISESEKGVMQLWSHEVKNSVGIGGKKIGRRQVEMLSRLNANICFAFDKDVDQKELEDKANMFVDSIPIYAIIDTDNILEEKQSPMDNFDKWEILVKNNIYKIK
jgi:DNA primase